MAKHLLTRFLTRWIVSGLGLWIAAALLGSDRLNISSGFWGVFGAGFFLALVNMAIKPLLVILSFPAIIFSLGLFMLVINGLTVMIASWIYSPLYVKSLWVGIVAGIILGFVNYLVSRILEDLS